MLRTESLWLFFEQVWVKEPGAGRRTPWHQDTTSWIAGGSQACGFWVSIDPLTAEESLEFVRGSHLGPLYAGIAFDPYDDTVPRYTDSGWPRLPDIEADRGAFDIISFPNEPGDAVLFHPSILHGGGRGRRPAAHAVAAILRRRRHLLPAAGRALSPVPGRGGHTQAGGPASLGLVPQGPPPPERARLLVTGRPGGPQR